MSLTYRHMKLRDNGDRDDDEMGYTLGTECIIALLAARIWPLGTSMETPEEKHLVVFNLIQSIMMWMKIIFVERVF